MSSHTMRGWWRLGPMAALLATVMTVTGCAGFGATRFGRPISDPSTPPTSITLDPVQATNPIQTQHKIKATVKDAAGRPVHSTLVEWTLARGPGAVGDIIEPGQDPLGRALKLDNTYAITGTNDNGETWISITSVHEGVTRIIAYVRDIKDANKHKAFAVKNWLDAKWMFPPAATNKVGTKHVLTTRVMRESDGRPLEGYEVKWRVASGPAAMFEESDKPEAVTKTDAKGVATATLVQAQPVAGVNSVGITVVKPEEPGRVCCPTTSGVVAEGTTTKTWVAPTLTISKTCAPSIVKGATGEFSFVVTNTAQVEATDVVVRDTLPAGFTHVTSSPSGTVEGSTVTWRLGTLAGGASRTVTMRLRPGSTGRFTNQVAVTSKDAAPVRAACETVVTEAMISIAKTCPAEGLVGDSLNYVVTVRNPGSATATDVVVTDTVPEGMRHASGARELTWRVGDLPAGTSRSETFTFVAEKTGTSRNSVKVTAAGGLSDTAQCQTVIRQPGLSIKKSGRVNQVLGRTVTYSISVDNPGSAPATNVVVADQIPRGMSYVSSTGGGVHNPGANTVSWTLGTLVPETPRSLQVTLRGDAEGRFCNTVTATADRSLRDSAEACTIFAGVPGVLLELRDNPDPVEVGTSTTYTVLVTNQGTTPLSNLKLVATIPEGLAYVSHSGAGQVVGRTVVFAAVPNLPTGEAFTVTVVARAVGIAGQNRSDVRFKVELTGDQLSRPVVEEESTNLYR